MNGGFDIEASPVILGESILRSTLHRLDVGLVVYADTLEAVYVNPAACRILGLSEAELSGRIAFHPRWEMRRVDGTPIAQPMHPVAEVRESGAPISCTLTEVHRPGPGDWRWVEMSVFPILDGGRVSHVVCALYDVTLRQTTVAEKNREHALAESVMDASVAGIVMLDTNGGIVFANPAAEEILGLSRSAIAGRRYDAPEWRATDLDGGPWPDAQQPFVRVMTTKAPVRDVRHCIEWPDGTRRTLSINGAPVLGPDGEVEQLVFVLNDITEAHESEKARREMESRVADLARTESLTMLAGGIAHDFNNLLVGMLSAADLARLELPEEHPARASLDVVESTARQAAQLTRQLLAYSGRGGFVLGPTAVADVLRELAGIPWLVGEGARVHYDPVDGLPQVRTDPTLLKQVLVELVRNGVQASGEGDPPVEVRAGVVEVDDALLDRLDARAQTLEPGRYVFVEVEDGGVGMTPAIRRRIFEPFFSTRPDGKGLGMAAVLGSLRSQGGFIEVDSEPGQGTRVRVYLRALDATPPPTPEVAGAGASALPSRVLIVDDEPTVRTITARILKRRGVRAEQAPSGPDALRRLLENDDVPDAVILDLTMPEMGGEQVLARIREHLPRLPVLLMSGFSEYELDGSDPLTGFIGKPFVVDDLIAALTRLVGAGQRP